MFFNFQGTKETIIQLLCLLFTIVALAVLIASQPELSPALKADINK